MGVNEFDVFSVCTRIRRFIIFVDELFIFIIMVSEVSKDAFHIFVSKVCFVLILSIVAYFFGGIAILRVEIISDFGDKWSFYFFIIEIFPRVVLQPGVFFYFSCASKAESICRFSL